MKYRSVVKMSLAAALVAGTQGCWAATIQVESEPGDARVFVDGRDLGKGPVTFQRGSSMSEEKVRVVLRRKGYYPFETTIANEFDWNGTLLGLGLSAVLGGGAMGYYFADPLIEREIFFFLGAGILAVGGGSAWLSRYKFRTRYSFDMALDPDAAAEAGLAPRPEAPVAEMPVTPGLISALGDGPAGPQGIVAAEPEIEVDVDIPPMGNAANKHAVALVVGVERYAGGTPPARFARRDAKVFKRYLQASMGVPAANVISLIDGEATAGSIRTAIEGQLRTMVEPGKSDVFIYFAGHGAPDVRGKAAYLVPYDGNPTFPTTSCHPVASMYEALDRLGARSVTVVLDTSFSGGVSRRDDVATLIADARPLFIEAKEGVIPKNMVVFSGASAGQTNLANAPMQHGLFTYHFLKGLQGEADADADGQVTAAEVDRYVKAQVARDARRASREQTPTLYGADAKRVLVRSDRR